MIYAGIDLHANNMVIVAINNNNKIVREAKLPSLRRALDDFFSTFSEPVQAVVECTSFWYWLSDWCRVNDIELKLAHAKMVKAISYAKVKTDKVDVETLAELLRADLIPEAHQAAPKRRELRELTRERLRMIQWRSKLQSTLWNLAAKYNVRISGTQWRYLGKLQSWLEPKLPAAASLQAQLILEQISQLQKHIQRLEQEIDRQSTFDEAAKRLMDVPGMGQVGGWTILAEIETSIVSQAPNSLPATADWCRAVRTAAGNISINPVTKMVISICEWLLDRPGSRPIRITRW
jgi:hypothetical protein